MKRVALGRWRIFTCYIHAMTSLMLDATEFVSDKIVAICIHYYNILNYVSGTNIHYCILESTLNNIRLAEAKKTVIYSTCIFHTGQTCLYTYSGFNQRTAKIGSDNVDVQADQGIRFLTYAFKAHLWLTPLILNSHFLIGHLYDCNSISVLETMTKFTGTYMWFNKKIALFNQQHSSDFIYNKVY